MEAWLWGCVGVFALIIVFLLIKIFLLQESAKELEEAFTDRLMTDTNTLMDLPSRDRYMCRLADSMNTQLRILRKKRQQYEQGNRELREAVTNISHDLRTPLTAICGYLDLLEQEELSGEAGRYLATIRNRTEALKQLTEELFLYSFLTSTAESDTRQEVDISRELEESISAYYAIIRERGIEPQIFLSEKPVIRKLNRNILARIFDNILSNAIKYSDGDLEVELQENGTIQFSNHASALDEISTGRLFDRFYTVETARKSTGLGLSIARDLTGQMGGTIEAQYQDGILRIRMNF